MIKFLFISIGLHLILAVALFITFKSAGPLAGGTGQVEVSFSFPHPPRSRSGAAGPQPLSIAPSPVMGEGGRDERTDEGEKPGEGVGPLGTDPLLAEIRKRIEMKKHYPLLAQRMGLSGKAMVAFQISEQGEPVGVTLKQSSGSDLLDEAALSTIREAKPYPFYKEPLSVWIRYEKN